MATRSMDGKTFFSKVFELSSARFRGRKKPAAAATEFVSFNFRRIVTKSLTHKS